VLKMLLQGRETDVSSSWRCFCQRPAFQRRHAVLLRASLCRAPQAEARLWNRQSTVQLLFVQVRAAIDSTITVSKALLTVLPLSLQRGVSLTAGNQGNLLWRRLLHITSNGMYLCVRLLSTIVIAVVVPHLQAWEPGHLHQIGNEGVIQSTLFALGLLGPPPCSRHLMPGYMPQWKTQSPQVLAGCPTNGQ
jgi:hypothetical protein